MSVLSYGVQSLHLLQFGIQSCISSLTFRVTIPAQFEVQSLHLLQFGVQSHHIFSVWLSKPCFQFCVQSRISSLAFRATISFQFGIQSHHPFLIWHSEPHLQFGIQSYHLFSVWHSEPPSLPSLGFQSHHLFSVWHLEPLSTYSLAVRATIFLQFGVQSHIFSLTFRVVVHFLIVRRSEPPSFFSLAFKATIPSQLWRSESLFSTWCSEPPCLLSYDVPSRLSQLDIHSYQFTVGHLEPPFLFSLAFRATISLQFGI